MDASGRKTCGAVAYGQVVWSCPANAGDKPVRQLAGDGGKKLVRRGDHGAAVTPLRRECRSDFGVPVLACVRLFVLHARQWVRSCTRHSLRPLSLEGRDCCKARV